MKNKDAASFSGTINDLKNRLLEVCYFSIKDL